MAGLRDAAAALYGAAWELRRSCYAAGLRRAVRVGARVVSIGNLSAGGAGKTTLALHLAARARERAIDAAIVCRRYRPGPEGEGDEERMFRAAVGPARCFAGSSKRELAARAAAAGAALVIVDDGFSHWALARDLDVVLLDRTDLWGGGALLPAGRLREPRRALQRAGLVVITRLAPEDDARALIDSARPWAPAARFAAARHAVKGVRTFAGEPAVARGPAHVVSATGNPQAVAASAVEAGFGPVTLSAYRDHHWFREAEARRELARAAGGALVLSRKDAVRWPAACATPAVLVLEVGWEWVSGGAEAERAIFAEGA